MGLIFEAVSWLAMIALQLTSIPQIILNYKRKSTEGVSWSMFLLLLFGMIVLLTRSFYVTTDPVIRLNYGIGSFMVLIVNLQFFYYRVIMKNHV